MQKLTYPNFPDSFDQTSIHFKRYIKFIESRPKRDILRESGYEVHHIIPRSLNGSDDPANLIKLSLREHYIIHMILFYLLPKSSMAYAFYQMSNNKKYNKVLSGRMYERVRQEFIERMSEIASQRVGELNPFYGNHHTEETRKSLSRARQKYYESHDHVLKGVPKTEEEKKRHSEFMIEYYKFNPNPRKGVSLSEEVKLKISETRKGKYTGEDNPFYGKTHSKESREKISEGIKNYYKTHDSWKKGLHGVIKQSEETCKKKSLIFSGEGNPMYGKKHSEETKEKMRQKAIGRRRKPNPLVFLNTGEVFSHTIDVDLNKYAITMSSLYKSISENREVAGLRFVRIPISLYNSFLADESLISKYIEENYPEYVAK